MEIVFAQQGYFVVMINPTGSTTFGQGIPPSRLANASGSFFAEFVDAIAEDWGGKPFVDMINGWKYVLDKYPEVCHLHEDVSLDFFSYIFPRLIQKGPLLLGLAGVDMLSSMFFWRQNLSHLTLSCSWIQGHPEFGFNFKVG